MKQDKCPKCGKDLVDSCPICHKPVEVYSRIVGYLRPISHWNPGKAQEFRERKEYIINQGDHQDQGENNV
jgi:ribonucleoside-triphosphate reductase